MRNRMTGIRLCTAKILCILMLFTIFSCPVSALSKGKDTSIRSMEEYERIIGSAVLPENFVPYEKVQMLGQLKRLVIRYQEREDNGTVSYIVNPGYFGYYFKDAEGMECRWYLEITEEEAAVSLSNSREINTLSNNGAFLSSLDKSPP